MKTGESKKKRPSQFLPPTTFFLWNSPRQDLYLFLTSLLIVPILIICFVYFWYPSVTHETYMPTGNLVGSTICLGYLKPNTFLLFLLSSQHNRRKKSKKMQLLKSVKHITFFRVFINFGNNQESFVRKWTYYNNELRICNILIYV